jgi:imidazolonepropionase-like amidohydrolase
MKTIVYLILILSPVAAAAANKIEIRCAKMIDVVSGQLQKNQQINIVGNKIASVKPISENKRDSARRQIVLNAHTCLPGLMDMHVHLISETGPNNFANQFRQDPADFAFGSIKFARRTLESGFTLVRDLGSSDRLAIALRNAINRGDVIGPRILAAGKSLATTGGHADPTNGRNSRFTADPRAKEGVVNGSTEARKAVRQRYKEGADLIKITATGGVLSQAASGQNAQFMDDELDSIISTARDYGFKVAAHAHGAEGMKRAIQAGVDSIEHGTLMDREAMKLMKKNGTYYVPTIIAGKFVAEKAKEAGFFSEVVRPKALAIGPKIQDTFSKAYESGVKIAFGTDSGVSPHGDNWKEFVYMVEAGMPEIEAIQSATVEAAKLAGNYDILGSIEVGKLADIIAVRGDPTREISAMAQVEFVMKNGEIFKLIETTKN